jgi:hypothetical protein
VRRCSRCGRALPLELSPLRRKDGTARHGHCRDCKAAYQRAWYERNGERHRAAAAANHAEVRERNKRVVREAKDRPCADCGQNFAPHVMDFDHVRGVKIGNIALLKTYAPTAVVLAEIAKCDVVCSNCHRIRTHDRRAAQPRPTGARRQAASAPGAAEAVRGPQQQTLWWVAGGSNSEPWA